MNARHKLKSVLGPLGLGILTATLSTSALSEESPASVEEDAATASQGAAKVAEHGGNDGKISTPNEGSVPDLYNARPPSQRESIGLEPAAPQSVAIPGGVTPAFNQKPTSKSDWLFDIHGFLMLPLRVGINQREEASAGQKNTVLHTPPVTPDRYESFDYTGATPDPWAQLNFSFGNRDVTATVIIAARTVANANGYFNPADQIGINDAFISFHPYTKKETKWNLHVGAFANRYGIMGQYDLGQYGTPLIARVGGIGTTGTVSSKLGDMPISAEAGFMGQLNKSPVGVEPAGWNGFTDPNAGTSFVAHGHFSISPARQLQLTAHAIYAFAQDDRATTAELDDGSIGVYGLDARFMLQRFGHLYFGYAHTAANTARTVSSVIRVLNAPGGYGLMQEYLGLESDGTGNLNTFGGEYSWSLGNFMRYPQNFQGEGADLVVTANAIGTAVSSPVPEYDGVFKVKYGLSGTYRFIKWMGAGLRWDRVQPDVSDNTQTYAVLSPRILFKSDWNSRDQVMLQYSKYWYGSNSTAWVGYPPQPDPTVKPDEHVVSLTGTFWW